MEVFKVGLIAAYCCIHLKEMSPYLKKAACFLQEVPVLCSKSCVFYLPLTDFLWLKILIAIIQLYCLSFFILADVHGVCFSFHLPFYGMKN